MSLRLRGETVRALVLGGGCGRGCVKTRVNDTKIPRHSHPTITAMHAITNAQILTSSPAATSIKLVLLAACDETSLYHC
jgi:hypothetical protein